MVKLLFCLLFPVVAVGDGKEVLSKMLDRYAEAKSIEMNYVITKSTGSFKEEGIYCASGSNYYSESGDDISLANKDYLVLVSKDAKTIRIMDREKFSGGDFMQNQEELAKSLDKIQTTVIERKANTRIKVSSPGSLIPEIYYEIDEKNSLLKRIEYTYGANSKQKSVTTFVSYTSTVLDKKFPKDYFSESRLVKKIGNEFKPTRTDLQDFIVKDLRKTN